MEDWSRFKAKLRFAAAKAVWADIQVDDGAGTAAAAA